MKTINRNDHGNMTIEELAAEIQKKFGYKNSIGYANALWHKWHYKDGRPKPTRNSYVLKLEAKILELQKELDLSNEANRLLQSDLMTEKSVNKDLGHDLDMIYSVNTQQSTRINNLKRSVELYKSIGFIASAMCLSGLFLYLWHLVSQ